MGRREERRFGWKREGNSFVDVVKGETQ